MYRLMRPDFKDIVPAPELHRVSHMKLQDEGMRPHVCRSICTGSQEGRDFVSPFLHGCISLSAAQRMKAKACHWEDNDRDHDHRNNRYTRFPENGNDAVIVRIKIMQMLSDDEIYGVLDMSSRSAVGTSL